MFEKEAEEYVKQNYCDICVMADDCKSGCIDCFTVQAYLASAEPRENRIEELEKENKVLAQNLEDTEILNKTLNNRDKEFKAQIEKMKSDVISERDEARRLEDTITYVVLNNILAKWGVKEK